MWWRSFGFNVSMCVLLSHIWLYNFYCNSHFSSFYQLLIKPQCRRGHFHKYANTRSHQHLFLVICRAVNGQTSHWLLLCVSLTFLFSLPCVLYKLLYNVSFTYPRMSVCWRSPGGPCSHFCLLASWSLWNQHRPLYLNNCAIQTSLHGYVRERPSENTSEVYINILYICKRTKSAHDFHVFESCFEICFYQNMFLPCRF